MLIIIHSTSQPLVTTAHHSNVSLQLSEGEEEAGPGEGKTMVSWLVGRCVDSLLACDHEVVRGIYIQVRQIKGDSGVQVRVRQVRGRHQKKRLLCSVKFGACCKFFNVQC